MLGASAILLKNKNILKNEGSFAIFKEGIVLPFLKNVKKYIFKIFLK